MQHKLLFSAIALALSYSAQAVIVPEGTQLDEKQHIVINNGAEPQSFDPQKTEGVPESSVAYQLLEGLVTSDSEGKLQPGVAESWENTPDFKTWTFHLRKDAKWSNGDPVTAHDFVFAWRRLVDPATAAPYASYLSYLQVENAQDIIDGKKKPAELGVEAKDDYTFVVHATNPVPYAVSLTTHQSLLPLPQKVVEKLGDAWVKKENYVGNGAYKLANHIINEKIEFERNPLYWNDKETVINSATFLAIENPSTDVARYRAGDLDMTNYALPPEQFAKLHYTAPGTDLTLGMPKNHVWESAGSINAQGEHFIANMPTEEVFSAPDFRVADGYVSSTKPLSYNGNIIEGIKVTFKDGQITEVSAEKGDQVMKDLVFENNGARGLGEVALVSDPSPISQSGITFFNTLFDENASNHLAIGSAYATSVKGGENFETEEELREAGLNRSDVHVDFMIGGPEMNVDGIREDGTVVPIFRNGDWAI